MSAFSKMSYQYAKLLEDNDTAQMANEGRLEVCTDADITVFDLDTQASPYGEACHQPICPDTHLSAALGPQSHIDAVAHGHQHDGEWKPSRNRCRL